MLAFQEVRVINDARGHGFGRGLGGDNNDTLRGGAGNDTLHGEGGANVLDSLDGEIDYLVGITGQDSVSQDSIDVDLPG
jgi:Ca2+-binding RTX toxin-like protein